MNTQFQFTSVGCTPRSIKSPDFECGRRCSADDLVLNLHTFEAPLASRSFHRSCLSSCLEGSDVGDRFVGPIVPGENHLCDLHISSLDRELELLHIFIPSTPFALDLSAGIGGLERLLTKHKPLISRSGTPHRSQ